MASAYCSRIEYDQARIQRWIDLTIKAAQSWRLEVGQVSATPASIIEIRTAEGEQKWVASDPLPAGAIQVSPARPGFVGVVVAHT